MLSVTKTLSSLIVNFGGTTVLTLTDPAFIPGVQEYTRFAFIVPATGATTTLSFGGFAAAGELNLDDVLVEELPGSVPVPESGSSALLFLIAVGALTAGYLSRSVKGSPPGEDQPKDPGFVFTACGIPGDSALETGEELVA